MKLLVALFTIIGVFLLSPHAAYAAENSQVAQFTTQTLNVLTVIASLVSAIFLVKGGYFYITSSGNPEALDSAKKTIRNALIGLVLVIGASTISSLLSHAFTTPVNPSNTGAISLTPIEPEEPSGLSKMMIDALVGTIQNLVQSGAKPIMDGIISFLTSTPSVVTNSVIFNFWLVILGITDSLFAIIIALLGFHFMSASALGFEELELKQVLTRILAAFIGANTSIFLIEWVINISNTLINAVLASTGGIAQAWVLNVLDPINLVTGGFKLLFLVFMLLFMTLAIVLLFFYISRLILISLGAVLSPIIFLLWALPPTSHFAEISVRTYLVTIFTVFVHVVTIQLASSFLTVTKQAETNSFIAILVGIGLFFTLLKLPGMMMQMAFYTSTNQAFRKIGTQVINVISSSNAQRSASSAAAASTAGKTGSAVGRIAKAKL